MSREEEFEAEKLVMKRRRRLEFSSSVSAVSWWSEKCRFSHFTRRLVRFSPLLPPPLPPPLLIQLLRKRGFLN